MFFLGIFSWGSIACLHGFSSALHCKRVHTIVECCLFCATALSDAQYTVHCGAVRRAKLMSGVVQLALLASARLLPSSTKLCLAASCSRLCALSEGTYGSLSKSAYAIILTRGLRKKPSSLLFNVLNHLFKTNI